VNPRFALSGAEISVAQIARTCDLASGPGGIVWPSDGGPLDQCAWLMAAIDEARAGMEAVTGGQGWRQGDRR
jgi:hypothetical protein